MKLRWATVLAVAICFSVRAECISPVAFAQLFYENHQDFYWNKSRHNPDLMTSRFGGALIKEWAFANGEVGHIDYNPWLGAQDGEIGRPIKFSVISVKDQSAVVSMAYLFNLGRGSKLQKKSVKLILLRESKGCWKLNDFITPLGESLHHVYSQP